MVGGKRGHAPCNILLLQQSIFLCQSIFCGDHKTVYKDDVNLTTLSFRDIPGVETVVSVSMSVLPMLQFAALH